MKNKLTIENKKEIIDSFNNYIQTLDLDNLTLDTLFDKISEKEGLNIETPKLTPNSKNISAKQDFLEELKEFIKKEYSLLEKPKLEPELINELTQELSFQLDFADDFDFTNNNIDAENTMKLSEINELELNPEYKQTIELDESAIDYLIDSLENNDHNLINSAKPYGQDELFNGDIGKLSNNDVYNITESLESLNVESEPYFITKMEAPKYLPEDKNDTMEMPEHLHRNENKPAFANKNTPDIPSIHSKPKKNKPKYF